MTTRTAPALVRRTDDATAVIADLRAKAEHIRRAEIRRADPLLRGLSPHDRARVDELTRALVAALLRTPETRLREIAADPRGAARARRVLGLDGPRTDAPVSPPPLRLATRR